MANEAAASMRRARNIAARGTYEPSVQNLERPRIGYFFMIIALVGSRLLRASKLGKLEILDGSFGFFKHP